MKTRAQSARILDYLATGKPLTPITALRRFGTFRLGARVYDLKRQGHKIDTRLVTRGDSRVASYTLVQ